MDEKCTRFIIKRKIQHFKLSIQKQLFKVLLHCSAWTSPVKWCIGDEQARFYSIFPFYIYFIGFFYLIFFNNSCESPWMASLATMITNIWEGCWQVYSLFVNNHSFVSFLRQDQMNNYTNRSKTLDTFSPKVAPERHF